MADTASSGAHYFLQLHSGVEGDPRIASLSPSNYAFFVRIRQTALQGETPGTIDLTWPALCECLGIRSPARQERIAQELEKRRLIGIRKDDEAIVIARWTMPQLNALNVPRETLPPRRKYPSDLPDARKPRSHRQYAEAAPLPPETAQTGPQADAPPAEDTAPSAAMQQFFADVEPLAETRGNSAESLAESGGVRAGSADASIHIKEEHNTPTTDSATPPTDSATRDKCEGVCDFLIVDCLVNANDAREAATWLPSLDEAQAYAFWAGEVRRLNPKPGGTQAGLLASLLREKKAIPPEYRAAYQQAKREEERAAKAAEKARKAQEATQAEADAHKIRLFNLAVFRQGLEPDALARFEADALKRVRQKDNYAAEKLTKNRDNAMYLTIWQEGQLAAMDAWPSVPGAQEAPA